MEVLSWRRALAGAGAVVVGQAVARTLLQAVYVRVPDHHAVEHDFLTLHSYAPVSAAADE